VLFCWAATWYGTVSQLDNVDVAKVGGRLLRSSALGMGQTFLRVYSLAD
jgi:hypothetical protein